MIKPHRTGASRPLTRSRPRVVKLPKPKVSNDSQFIRTLLWLLEKARQGEVVGYAVTCSLVGPEGPRDYEVADVLDPEDAHHVLGCIRHMEMNFMRRQWPE